MKIKFPIPKKIYIDRHSYKTHNIGTISKIDGYSYTITATAYSIETGYMYRCSFSQHFHDFSNKKTMYIQTWALLRRDSEWMIFPASEENTAWPLEDTKELLKELKDKLNKRFQEIKIEKENDIIDWGNKEDIEAHLKIAEKGI